MDGFDFIDDGSLNPEQQWAEHGTATEELPPGVVDPASDPNYWVPTEMRDGLEGAAPYKAAPVPGQEIWTAGHGRADRMNLDDDGYLDSGEFLVKSDWMAEGQTHVRKMKLKAKGYDVECCGGCEGDRHSTLTGHHGSIDEDSEQVFTFRSGQLVDNDTFTMAACGQCEPYVQTKMTAVDSGRAQPKPPSSPFPTTGLPGLLAPPPPTLAQLQGMQEALLGRVPTTSPKPQRYDRTDLPTPGVFLKENPCDPEVQKAIEGRSKLNPGCIPRQPDLCMAHLHFKLTQRHNKLFMTPGAKVRFPVLNQELDLLTRGCHTLKRYDYVVTDPTGKIDKYKVRLEAWCTDCYGKKPDKPTVPPPPPGVRGPYIGIRFGKGLRPNPPVGPNGNWVFNTNNSTHDFIVYPDTYTLEDRRNVAWGHYHGSGGK